MSAAAIRHLSRDPAFARLIRRVGPPRLAAEIDRRRSPYEALMRAIAHQQLHGRAAEAILARFIALHPGCAGFPDPAMVLAHPETALRGCGFSAGKIAALRDICAHALNGTVPTRRGAVRLSDEALIERLTGIRGVGRWTVEMLLIFAPGPAGRAAGRRFRRARGLSRAARAGGAAEAARAGGDRRGLGAVPLVRRVVSVARGRMTPKPVKVRVNPT